MGNSNSAETNQKQNRDTNQDQRQSQNNPEPKYRKTVDPLLTDDIDKMYDNIHRNKGVYNANGVKMIYVTCDKMEQNSSKMWNMDHENMFFGESRGHGRCGNAFPPAPVSENIKHIEVIFHDPSSKNQILRYPVHSREPNHDCRVNCPICIRVSESDNQCKPMYGGASKWSESDDYDAPDLFSTTSEDSDMVRYRQELEDDDYDIDETDNYDNYDDDSVSEEDIDDSDLRRIDAEDEKQMIKKGYKEDKKYGEDVPRTNDANVFNIFQSDTESDYYNEDSTTERVRYAMNRANYLRNRNHNNKRNNIQKRNHNQNRRGRYEELDAEYDRIMDMGTEDANSSDYFRRPVNLNNKYR